MITVERRHGNYTIDDFKPYITNEYELETLKNWLDKKTNLNLEILSEPIRSRFMIKIEMNSALDRIFVIDRLDRNYVELTDWDSF